MAMRSFIEIIYIDSDHQSRDLSEAHDAAWEDHATLEVLINLYVRAWNAQRHDDCIRILRRVRQIKGSRITRPAERCEVQRDYDDAVAAAEPWV